MKNEEFLFTSFFLMCSLMATSQGRVKGYLIPYQIPLIYPTQSLANIPPGNWVNANLVMLESRWVQLGGRVGVALGSRWGHVGGRVGLRLSRLGSSWGGSCWGSCWGRVGVMLGVALGYV